MDVTADGQQKACRIVADGVEEGPVETEALNRVVVVLFFGRLSFRPGFLVSLLHNRCLNYEIN